MAKLKNIREFTDYTAELKKTRQAASKKFQEQVHVCVGGGCLASGSQAVADRFAEVIRKNNLQDRINLVNTGCLGPCIMGPVAYLAGSERFLQGISVDDVEKIVMEGIVKGEKLPEFQCEDPVKNTKYEKYSDIPFFNRQTRIALNNCGIVDPLKMDDYLARDGYAAAAKVLTKMKPAQVLDEMKLSGLRGRGGAGFPTYLKWKFAQSNDAKQKYILCNADEGDPGAYMDRSLLEGDPHSVIEGMIIGGYTIGATVGYVYVRAEYPLAVERLREAINQAEKAGLLGKNILDSGFSFQLGIRMGSGAFVCGEETALMASIEGKRGEPRPRPPFPAEKGLWASPTVLNNVETYANVPGIIRNGGKWFAALGTEKSKGTKVFALAGSVRNSGLVEVPIGTTLGELIYDIGGGVKEGKNFKAAQIGGPSGGCVPKQHLNVPLDYESLSELGAIMGSGGLVVMDEDTCMVDVARFFLEFVQEESCGKCVPCRVGTKRMLEILERICAGKGKEEDIDTLVHLGTIIRESALCGLGQTAPNPVLSTIRHFRHEYEEHINRKLCSAGVCAGLVKAPCRSACPANVNVPGFVSLVGERRYAEALQLHRERNPFAAVCARVCFHTCEDKCRRADLDSAVAIRGIKRYMVDQEITMQVPEVKRNKENAARKIAIVGAGPAGLSCAYFLARLGYKPVVFEAEARPGGMLVQMIPAYRLPRETLAREIRMIENLGVDIRTEMRLGKDFTLESLRKEGYEAVFVGIGAGEGLDINLPVKGKKDKLVQATDFLRTYNLRGSVSVGKKVVIIGGGNAAIDTARTAVRLGSDVTVVYRRTRAEMPAYEEEIEHAEEEGVKICTLVNPEEIDFSGSGNGKVVCTRMKLGDFDRSGRRRPVATDKKIEFEADQVIMACGQIIPEADTGEMKNLGIISANGWISTDPVNGKTAHDWLFSGGDASAGPASVIEAVADGEAAAVGINDFLGGEIGPFWREDKPVNTFFDPDADPVDAARREADVLNVARRKNNFDEVEQPWVEPETILQAKRCLRCDYGRE
ncbi:MAG: NADH-quinone oxidoreductase subunit NuoF [Spirochaetales bacterium]|nr:NADH-quinone oxidoreductase subunit NuoF [Spirochaetales bacterium]